MINTTSCLSKWLAPHLHSETEKYRKKERLAAIDIQKNWRMLRVKWSYQQITMATRFIQRVYRGHRGRT